MAIYFCVLNYPGGVEALAADCQDVLSHTVGEKATRTFGGSLHRSRSHPTAGAILLGGTGTWLRQGGEMCFAPDTHGCLSARNSGSQVAASISLAGVGSNGAFYSRSRRRFLRRGTGMLSAWIFGFIPVVRARGRRLTKVKPCVALPSLPWHPFAFGEVPRLAWEAVEGDKLLAGLNDGKTQAAIVFQR